MSTMVGTPATPTQPNNRQALMRPAQHQRVFNSINGFDLAQTSSPTLLSMVFAALETNNTIGKHVEASQHPRLWFFGDIN